MVSPRTLVAAPVRRPYVGGLLAAANVIESSDPHIAQGVQYDYSQCMMPVPAPGLCWSSVTVTGTKDEIGTPGVQDAQLTFAIYAGVECFMYTNDDYEQQARDLLLGGETFAIERVFHDEFLADVDSVDAPAGSAVTGGVGIAEQYLGAHYPALGMIHANRYVTNLAAKEGLVANGVTVQGTPWANGAGYVTDPDTLATEELSELWATGLVSVWRGPVVVTRTNEPTLNKTLAIAERVYSISVDCFAQHISFATTP